MGTNGANRLDNLSDLGARLREIEVEHVVNEDGTAVDAREEVLEAVRQYHSSRYRFGEALAAYKAYYIDGQHWMEAAKIIGRAINRDERTIRRILEDYERASQVPATVIEELEAKGIDPAARMNQPLLATILTMPSSTVESKPEQSVVDAVKTVKAMKATKRAAKKLVQTVVASGENECAPLTRQERLRRDTRLKIRTALTDVPINQKLAEFIAALEEEMYEAWGEREPTTITMTPRPSALTLGGLRKKECAA